MARIYHTWHGFYPVTGYVTDGLVSYWDASVAASYPGTGTDVFDLVGSNHGSLEGTTSFDSANGGSFLFTATPPVASINCGNVLNMGTNSLTICCFINKGLGTGASGIAGKTAASAANNRYALYWDLGKVTMVYDIGGTQTATAATNISGAGWLMITAIWPVSGPMAIFINDTDDTDSTSVVGAANVISSFEFRIGSYANSTGTAPLFPFDGKIGNCLVYNKALSSAEVAQNFNALKSRFGL